MDRKVIRSDEADSPRVERVGNVWHVRAVDLARQVLREKEGSHQAGFLVEVGSKATQSMRPPILWMDGADYLIDIGPDGGDLGGCVIASGTPEAVAQVAASHTGKYLQAYSNAVSCQAL